MGSLNCQLELHLEGNAGAALGRAPGAEEWSKRREIVKMRNAHEKVTYRRESVNGREERKRKNSERGRKGTTEN